MYKCKECGEEFDRPHRYVNNEYYGSYDYAYCCPWCGGVDYERMAECNGCGKEFGESELTEGFCVECEKEIQDKVTAFFSQFTDEEKTYIFESDILQEA